MIILAAIALIVHDIWPNASSVSLTFLTLLAFFPVCYCLLQGQDSILLLFLFVMSFWFSRRGQDDAAGFALAFGLFRPQLVLPFALVAFLAGKWKFVRGFIPGAFLAVALSTWVVGFHGMAEYARVLISQGTQNSAVALAERWQVHPGLMPTLRGFLWMFLPSSVPGIIQAFLLLAGVSLGLSWAASGIRSTKDEATLDRAFALAVAASVLVSYHSFLHDFSLIILPVLIVSSLVPSMGPRLDAKGRIFNRYGWVPAFPNAAISRAARYSQAWSLDSAYYRRSMDGRPLGSRTPAHSPGTWSPSIDFATCRVSLNIMPTPRGNDQPSVPRSSAICKLGATSTRQQRARGKGIRVFTSGDAFEVGFAARHRSADLDPRSLSL